MPMKRKVTIDVKESVESGRKVFVRYQEGAELYSVGLHTFQNWAKDAGAVYKIRDYGREQFDSIRGTSQYEYDDGNEIGEWFAQGGTGGVISEVLNVGRRVEQAVSGDAQGVGRGDATDPTVMSKYRERKRDSEDESEEQYQGIQM